MKTSVFLLATLFGVATAAADTVFSLLPAPTDLRVGGTVEIRLVVLNTGADASPLELPAVCEAAIRSAGPDRPVRLVTEDPTHATLAPGRFAIVRYRTTLPAGTRGAASLVLQPPAGPALLLPLGELESAPRETPVAASPPLDRALAPTEADSAFQRLFVERFNAHQPVYFIYGADDPVAKLQFSLKYRLLGFGEHDGEPPRRTVQFGYTQRSLWDIKGSSSPFYDTSYMPEVFFETMAAPVEHPRGPARFLGLQTGFLHESNGRDGLSSRSLNQFFARTYFLVGPTERWHAVLMPEFWFYAGAMEDNPRLKDYRGYGRFSVALGYGDGPSLLVSTHCGKDFDHPTVQADLAVPLRLAMLDFKTFFLLQYFNGYGESLLDYDRHSQTVRAGMALVR